MYMYIMKMYIYTVEILVLFLLLPCSVWYPQLIGCIMTLRFLNKACVFKRPSLYVIFMYMPFSVFPDFADNITVKQHIDRV